MSVSLVTWIGLCALASVGVVQIIAWVVCRRRRPAGVRRGYHVVPLYDGPDGVEAQLRYSLSQIHWGGCGGEIVVLMDMGLGNESLAICEEMMGKYGLLYCREGQLAASVRKLDDLQIT